MKPTAGRRKAEAAVYPVRQPDNDLDSFFCLQKAR
jgi:hypothetical protein